MQFPKAHHMPLRLCSSKALFGCLVVVEGSTMVVTSKNEVFENESF